MKNLKGQYLKEMLYLLGSERQKVLFIIPLFVLSSILDVVGIGLIAPYVTVILAPETTAGQEFFRFVSWFNLPTERESLLVIFSFFLLFIFFVKTVMIIIINWVIFNFGHQQQVRLRNYLMRSYQNLPYEKFLRRNSSEYMLAITAFTGSFSTVLQTVLKTISEGFVAIVLLIMLAIINLKVLLILLLLIGTTIYIYNFRFKNKVKNYGRRANISSNALLKGLQEGMKGLKEIRILGVEDYFYKKVSINAAIVARNNVLSNIINVAPRYLMELVFVVFIILTVLVSIMFRQDVTILSSTLAVFGVAALRLMPSANVISSSLITLKFQRDSISKLYSDLVELKLIDNKKTHVQFNTNGIDFSELTLDNITFSYPNSRSSVLKNLSMQIKKGQSIGVVGKTGSGKTTLIDIILGLLHPQHGRVLYNNTRLIDNMYRWRSQVAYLPQQVFLIDESLRNNIALGINENEIDEKRVFSALRKAHLMELVNELPDGLDTFIGENGMRLSGGQRQRIALARAFYHNRSVIVMDESTSALDSETESEVVKEINYLKGKVTTIVIAHNLSTLRNCDIIYKVQNGNIIQKND
jgi:ATP-binding cassette, subfamily B, bacterial PglK